MRITFPYSPAAYVHTIVATTKVPRLHSAVCAGHAHDIGSAFHYLSKPTLSLPRTDAAPVEASATFDETSADRHRTAATTMKVFSNAITFNYSWEEVSTANWRKYCPWNDKSTHVIAVDTLSRKVDAPTGILRTERLITCKQSAPEWLKAVIGGMDTSTVYEVSYVNPADKTVTMVSQNMSWSNLVSVQETVVYRPLNATQTRFSQDARVTALCGGWQRIKNNIEESLIARFRENAVKGKEGFEAVLEMSRKVFLEERAREMFNQAAKMSA